MEATLFDMQQKISYFIKIINYKNDTLNQLNAQLVYYNLFKYSFIFSIAFSLILLIILLVVMASVVWS